LDLNNAVTKETNTVLNKAVTKHSQHNKRRKHNKKNSLQAGKLLQALPNTHEHDKKLFYPPLLGKRSKKSSISRNAPTCYIMLAVCNPYTEVLMKQKSSSFSMY